MKRITIGRYPTLDSGYSGWIEGVTDDDENWILYVDQHGRPEVFWPNRESKGPGIILDEVSLKASDIMHDPNCLDRMGAAVDFARKVKSGDPEAVAQQNKVQGKLAKMGRPNGLKRMLGSRP